MKCYIDCIINEGLDNDYLNLSKKLKFMMTYLLLQIVRKYVNSMKQTKL